MALLLVNAALSAATIVFALLGALRPSALSHSPEPSPGERFYGRMYALRGVPLGVLALVLPLARSGPAVAAVLIAAAFAQVGDGVLGIARREWTMVAGPLVVTAVHVATALAVR
ncbi:hypothetical protein [Catenuloplanes japonicus]|uniref:hypothetical protein n=1 Tax=Catenuloplanes japonicus TaxID=33876 RepID=UPI000525AD36|nr:hypothetical protein [Catenuloplanes japonicus]